MGRVTGCVLAAMCLCTTAHAQVGASTEAHVTVDWTAPEGCPSGASIETEVARLVGPVGVAGPSPVSGRVLQLASGAYEARLETGGVLGEGVRVFEGESCQAVADASALLIALLLQPTLETPDEPPAQSTGAEGEPEAALRPTRRPERVHAGRTFVVGLSLTGDLGTLPALAAGPGLALAARVGPVSLRIRALWLPPRHARLENYGGDFSLITGALSACLGPRDAPLSAGPCLGLEGGGLRGRGTGVSAPRAGTSIWLSGLAGGYGRLSLGASLGLRIEVEASVPFFRPPFLLSGIGEVHRASPVAVRASFGVEASF